MTSYFDTKASEVAALNYTTDEEFINGVSAIEEGVLKDVEICVNDREFPDDLRRAINQTVYARRLSNDGTEHAKDMAVALRSSTLLSGLHSHFHDLARRNLKTRFGRWSDHPDNNAARVKEQADG